MTTELMGTITTVEYRITFRLGTDEQKALPARGHNCYVLLDTVVVEIGGKRPLLTAMGRRCRKDGTFSPHWGNMTTLVDLPDPEVWIERAKEYIQDYVP
jgi:hypothetical protein